MGFWNMFWMLVLDDIQHFNTSKLAMDRHILAMNVDVFGWWSCSSEGLGTG